LTSERVSLERLEDAITYIVAKSTHPVTRTKLVKLLYFIDLRGYEQRREPIIGVPWRWHHFGPFAKEIYDAVQTLDVRDELRVEATQNYYGSPEYHLKLGPQAGYFGPISDNDVTVIDGVLHEFEGIPSARLAELSYYTYPMESVQRRGELLDFSAYCGARPPSAFVPDLKAPPPQKMTS
jgi:hypothetical protein